MGGWVDGWVVVAGKTMGVQIGGHGKESIRMKGGGFTEKANFHEIGVRCVQ